MRMIRTQIMLDEEQHQYLQREARARNVSISEVLRRLLSEEMSKISHAQVRGAEMIAEHAESGPEAEVQHDEVLYR